MRGRRPFLRGPKRKLAWEYYAEVGIIHNSTVSSARWIRVPAGKYDSGAQGYVQEDCTLVKMLLTPVISTTVAAAGNCIAGIGIIAWKGVDENVPTEFPLPMFDADQDWIIRAPMCYQGHASGGQTVVNYFSQSAPYVISKAQRKLSDGYGLLLVCENFVNSSDNGALFGYDARWLVKLP